MSTLQDDLETQEDQQEHPERVTPMTDEERALLAPYEQELPEFDPSKRLAKNNATKQSPEGQQDQSKTPQNSGVSDIPFNAGSEALGSALKGAGVAGGIAVAAKAALGAIQNNKGKAIGGAVGIGGTAFMLFGLGFFVASLGLVHIKNNVEKRADSISNSIFDQTFADSTMTERSAIKRLFRSLNVEKNINKLDESLAKSGYRVTAQGLETPNGLLDDVVDIRTEVKAAAKEALPVHNLRGLRMRNKAAKDLATRIGVARAAAIAADLKADKDPRDQVVEDSRKQAFDSEAGTSEQLEKARSEGAGDITDADKELVEELSENGDVDVDLKSPRSLPSALAAGSDDVVAEIAEEVGSQSLAARAGGALKGNMVDIIDISCTIGSAARTAYVAGLIAKKANLMKLFSVFANNADAVVTGQVNSKLLNGFMEATWSTSSGVPMTASTGMQNVLNGTSNEPGGAALSFFRTDRQDVGGFLTMVIALAGNNAVKTFCKTAQNPVSQIGLSLAEWAGTAVLAVGTSGTGAVATTTASTAVKQSMGKMIGSALIKALGQAVAIETVSYLGKTWIEHYTSNVFSSTMATISKGEAGPFNGEGFSSGGGAFYEQAGRHIGMGPQTQSAYLDLRDRVREEQRTELAQKSLYERFVDVGYDNTESLASLALIGSPVNGSSPSAVSRNIASSFINLSPLNNASKFASAAVTTSAFAQDGGTKVDENGYVIDVWGNYIVGNNFDNVNMLANYDSLLSAGEIDDNGEPVPDKGLAKYIEACTDIDIRTEDASNKIRGECDSSAHQASLSGTNSQVKRFQAYLAFRSAFEALDTAYNPAVELATETPAPGGSGSVPTGVVTEAETAPTTGCGGIRVHKSIVAKLDQLCAAASAAGTPLTGSGWRDTTRQIELRKKHCGTSNYAIYEMSPSSCNPPTARPGRSMHEKGLAIDFQNCSSHSTACFKWLAANAAKYGFYNLPSEAWHWSINGS